MKILLTGANGFAGQELLKYLVKMKQIKLSIAVRNEPQNSQGVTAIHKINSIDGNTNWHHTLKKNHVVIHLAARVHIMKDQGINSLNKYRKVNVDGTINLARQSIEAGIKRFIYISSIKVNGESTTKEKPFYAEDKPEPQDAYAISKYEAEKELLKITSQSNMELVIIRPVAMYGENVKGNFLKLINWVSSGIPLPLASIENSRSFLSLDNFVDFIKICLKHPAANRQIFLLSDGQDISTPVLLQKVAELMGKKINLFHVSPSLLNFFAKLVGKKIIATRLCDNLQVDIKKNYNLLKWSPLFTTSQGLTKVIKSISK